VKPLRELTGALLFLVVLGLRQWFAPVKGVTYTGRHRVLRDHLTTMQETAASARAQQAALVAIDIHDRSTETLPKREPGKAAALLEEEWYPLIEVDADTLTRIAAGPSELDDLTEKGAKAGWLVRAAAPGHLDVTDDRWAEVA
jgi:hypothetical protein